MHRFNRGFSLVELLVVITIIGVLMALIIPGVNMVREISRQATCLNNQSQLAKAIFAYEGAKNHLPGVLNQTSGGVQYNWVEAIFPYLDRNDMWKAVSSNNVASIQTMRLAVTICPNDPFTVDPTSPNAQALLSYGVNDQFFCDLTHNPPVDRSGTNPVAPAILSKLTTRPGNPAAFARGESVSASTTIMIGERTGDGTAANSHQSGPWTIVTPTATAWAAMAFIWPPQPTPPASPTTPISPNIMVSAHPGKVIAAFFDGHCEKVNNDTTYPQ